MDTVSVGDEKAHRPTGDMDAFDLLDKIPGVRHGPGGVICLYDRLVSLKGSDRVIPINYL